MINARGIRRRLSLAIVAVFVVIGVFSVRLIDIQVVRADALSNVAGGNYREAITWGTRGSIVDANGTVLASSVDRFNITAAPDLVDPAGFQRVTTVDGTKTREDVSFQQAVTEIAEVTGADPAQLTAALTTDPESELRVPREGGQARRLPGGAGAAHPVGLQRTAAGTQLPERGDRRQHRGADGHRRRAVGHRAQVERLPRLEQRHHELRGQPGRRADARLGGRRDPRGERRHRAPHDRLRPAVVRPAGHRRAGHARSARAGAPRWSSRSRPARSSPSPTGPPSTPTTSAPPRPRMRVRAASPRRTSPARSSSRRRSRACSTPASSPRRRRSRCRRRTPTACRPAAAIHDSWGHGTLNYTTAGILVNSSNIGIGQISELMPLAAAHRLPEGLRLRLDDGRRLPRRRQRATCGPQRRATRSRASPSSSGRA